MPLQNKFIKSFPSFQDCFEENLKAKKNKKDCFKENLKAEKKESIQYKLILWTLLGEILIQIILIFFVFKIIFLNIEKRFDNFYDDNKVIIINKTFENSIKINVDKNNNILVNYTFRIEVLNNTVEKKSNFTSVEVKHKDNMINKTQIISNEITNQNFIVSISNFTINSTNIKSDIYKDQILFKLLRTNYFKLKWVYWFHLFLTLTTFLLASLIMLLDKKIIVSNNFIYEISKILILYNIVQFFQLSIFLTKNFEVLDYKFDFSSKYYNNVYFSFIIIASVLILFCSFLFNFLLKNQIQNILICCLYMIFEEILTSVEFNIFPKENLIDIFSKFLLYMLFIWQTKISESYEDVIKNKTNKQTKKIKALKKFFNFLNIPIIKINPENMFVCNQAYFDEIYMNINFDKKFEIFKKLNKMDLKFSHVNDIEYKAKFIFSINNINLSTSIENRNITNKINYHERIYRNSLKNQAVFNNYTKIDINKNSIFKLSGIDTREDLINIFECYKKEIDINFNDLNKEISFYENIPNNTIQNRMRKLLIKKNCHFLIEKISKINLEFIKYFCVLINKFYSENQIDNEEFLKIGEMMIHNESRKGKKFYDLYIRYNELNDFLEFTFKNQREIVNISNCNSYPEKMEYSCFNYIFPQFIKKICHEIRNPIINILQLVNDLKKLNNKDGLSVSKVLNIDENDSNLNVNDKNPQEGNSEVYDIICNDSNINSFRMSSFDKSMNKNINNSQYDSKMNNLVNFINLNKQEKSKQNSSKTLKISLNNNFNNNINNSLENSFNRIINNNIITNNDKNISTANNLIFYDVFENNEYHKNLKKIKCISKMINFTIQEFEFLQYIIQSKNNKSIIVKKLKENIHNNKINLNLKTELNKFKRLFENMIAIANKKLKLEIIIDERVPQNINFDIKAIDIILFNLLSNAIKFSFAGEIKVNVLHNNELNMLSLNISDEGIGISEEFLKLVGTFMFKIKNRNNINGLGLGIYHVKLILEALEGNLLISSKIGKGTNVYIDFKTLDQIEELEIHNSYSDKTKNYSEKFIFEYDKIINQNILDKKLFKNFKTSYYNNECSKKKEIKSFIDKMKRTKTTKEKIKNKLSISSDTEKENIERLRTNYKILISSTNNLNKKTNFHNLTCEPSNYKYNFYNKISSSNLSEKYSLGNFGSNLLSSNYHTKNNANQNDINVNNSNKKKFASQKTFSSYESNSSNLFLKKICDENNISNSNINNCDESNNEDNYIGKINNNLKTGSQSEDLNINRYNYSESKKLKITKDYRNSKTFNSINDFNQQRHSNKIQNEIEEWSNKFKTTNNSSTTNDPNKYFYRKILDNKAPEIDFPVTIIGKRHSFANENIDYDKLEKSIITVKNEDNYLIINYNDMFQRKNIYNTIESSNDNLKNSIYSNTLIHIDNNENKLKDSGKCSLISNIKLSADHRINKDKTYKFLVVDDEILIRKSQMNLIEKYFRKKKIKIELTECSDGVECLYKLYEGMLNGIKYDMIFTDETMNFIRGTAMACIIKSLIQENILYDIKIFMVTSYDKSILSTENGNCNIDFFCSKPLSTFSLDKVFSRLMF